MFPCSASAKLSPELEFPKIGEILRFEGLNGPDGVKRKSPGRSEPWHFIDPLGEDHDKFLALLEEHYNELVRAIKANNRERIAFEAAWLAHTIVDGLTPAHHYPYEQRINEMRKGGNKGRQTVKDKLVFRGETKRQTLHNTYKVYGPKGLMTSHFTFEHGVNFIIRPLRLPDALPKKQDIEAIGNQGYKQYFINSAREVAALDLYEIYLSKGWTAGLSNKIRHQLAPSLVRTVTLTWYAAVKEAGR